MIEIDKDKLANEYNEMEEIWSKSDPWHCCSHRTIEESIRQVGIPDNFYVLNAGSGGNNYGLSNRMHHMDIAEKKICNTEEYTVGSIEALPFANNTFDAILCVGSVINYCDPVPVIYEFHRVLKSGGCLLLEFENSYSFEYFGRDAYKRDASIIKCIFQGKEHHNWVFSHKYICALLKYNNFRINKKMFFHIISPLILRMGFSEGFSARFFSVDFIARHIPILRTHAGNIFLTCTKE